ncbi:MAG: DUF502 domain-containing protein [Planctomycetota bacterium]|jgi:uncharacterized membrane protein|nr:DUF502 domain-containing protein [Planctomycetota bacterium]MDP6988947.1 DUF502 domain-containing protein [Planctomycetota bacterium]
MDQHESRKQRRKRSPARRAKRKKSFFLRGVVTVLPAVLTLFILVTVVQFAKSYVTTPINTVIYWCLEGNGLGWQVLRSVGIDPLSEEFLNPDALPVELRSELDRAGLDSPAFRNGLAALHESRSSPVRDLDALAIDPEGLRDAVKGVVHPMIGVFFSLLLVLTAGYLASGFFGRRMISGIDRAMQQVPVIRSVYPYAKQLVEFFLSDTELEFDTVVAAPYPSEGVWAIAFVTSEGMKSVHEHLGGRYVSCFVPTSPMPMTGFTVFIEARRLIPLPISVEEALRTTVSAGVLIPTSELIETAEGRLAAARRGGGDDEQADVPESA